MKRRLLLTLLLTVAGSGAIGAPRPVTVFAAASLTEVMQQIGDAYTRSSGQPVVFSFAGTATLARQLVAGARADVFISADEQWMDDLATQDVIDRATRHDLFGSRLVLVAPASSNTVLTIGPKFPLLKSLGASGRLSIADPQAVPAGRYAKAALQSLGIWNDLTGRLAISDNVRTALNFVARGEAAFGIVYETDARAEPRVKVIGVFPAGSHPPVRFPVARVRGSTSSGFLEFLSSVEAQAIATRAGFTLPARD